MKKRRRDAKRRSGSTAQRPGVPAKAAFRGALERGRELHRAGQLDAAKELYRQHLQAQPRDADALHLLGFAEFQSYRFLPAVELIAAAVKLRPHHAEFQNNLALAYLAAGQLAEARQHAVEAKRLGHADGHGYWHVAMEFVRRRKWPLAEEAVALSLFIAPNQAEAHHAQGIVYAEQQRLSEAESCFRRALELQPHYLEAMNNLANALRDQERVAEAIPWYNRALELAPPFAAAHNNLGVAWANEGRLADAIACYQRALQLQPAFAEAVNNLGNAYRELGRREEALECYRLAHRLQPDSPEIQSSLAIALRQKGELREATAWLRRAIVQLPKSVKIYSQLTATLGESGLLDEAVACFHHLGKLEPDQPLWQLQAASVCPTVFVDRQEMHAYHRQLHLTLEQLKDRAFPVDLASFPNVAACAPFNLQFFETCVRPWKEAFASLYAGRLADAYQSPWVEKWQGPAARPRIGIVVTEDHEGIFLKSLQGVLNRLTMDLQLVVFCSHRGQARIAAALHREDVQLIPLPSHFHRMIRTIDDARCDLLYYWEVGTDSSNYFLPYFRLAPVQMTSWGIQVTTGIPTVDYYVSSELVEPADAQEHYSEALVLAKTLLTYRTRTIAPQNVGTREQFPLPAQAHWYVCAQQLGKFHIDFDTMLGEILRQDEQGIVVITADKEGRQASRLRQRFQKEWSDVADRIQFLPRLESGPYLSLLHHADVLLDPPHFGGVNSTYDGLSLGKAIVVLPSRFHRGRYGSGCYRKMGLDECLVETSEQYVRRAVELATNEAYRRDVETRIREASEGLFEDHTAVTEHERIFQELLGR